MKSIFEQAMTRRTLLATTTSIALAAGVPLWSRSSRAATVESRLVAGPAWAQLVPSSDTAVWAYNDRVPGPEIRLRQGERLKVVVENRLQEPTTVHWHGVRVPNAMDGVPDLTQPPIAPGQSFTYEFDAPDAGTFWYHPHQRSFEQVARGLHGPLIVEEREPIQVERDVVWVLDDWRLLRTARISDDFGSMMDMSMSGRIGNTVTINGRLADRFDVRAGERIRLRLINAANARIFGLDFGSHRPWIVALDGQPVEPHQPEDRILLGPAMRVDIVIDMTGQPGQRVAIRDTFYRGLEYRLVDLVYSPDPPIREHPLDVSMRLPVNPVQEPDLQSAQRHEIAFGGGMMSGMSGDMMRGGLKGGGMGGMMGGMMGGGMMGGMMRGMQHGGIWTVNGVSATGHVMDPLLTLERGRSTVLALRNDTAWHHPIHLHGHTFRVISRDGRPTRYREWQDTVLMPPRERTDIAFVADNPGDWMIHCHILEHQQSGMMAVIRVT